MLMTKQQTIDGLRSLADKLEQADECGDGIMVHVSHHTDMGHCNHPLALIDLADEWDGNHRQGDGFHWTNFKICGIDVTLFFDPAILPGDLTDNRMSLADFYEQRKGVVMEQ